MVLDLRLSKDCGCRETTLLFFCQKNECKTFLIQLFFVLLQSLIVILKRLVVWTNEDMVEAVRVLESGGLILYPTDTVWGIGCDATQSEAVARIYRLKEREDSKSMLVLVADEAQLRTVTEESEAVYAQAALLNRDERPTTIIYSHARGVAENLIAEDGSIGIRLSREGFSQELCRRLGRPIVSTSANISGKQTAKCFEQIEEVIRRGVDYICLYRRDDRKEYEPSRIVKIKDDGTYITIRP